MEAKIDIIMGVYNCAETLEESVDSILNQTYTNWHFIICDDCSTDNTYNILKKYKKKFPDKFTILKNKQNMGLNYTLNKCLEKTTSEFIARQDGDDISLPTRFEEEMKIIEKSDYALVSSSMISFDENGDFGVIKHPEKPTVNDFRFGSPFCHAPVIMRKSVLDEVDGYSVAKHLLRVEDYHLWFKIYSKGYKGYNIQKSLYKMRYDRNAVKRRTFKNRINEARLKLWGFNLIGVSKKYYVYILKPLILALMPSFIYNILHRNKVKKDS